MPGNRDIWEILRLAATQWRVGFNGAYGLDYNVLIAMAPIFGIQPDRTFFEKIKIFETAVLEHIGAGLKPAQQCNEEQKKLCAFEYGEYLEWACKNCKM